MAIIYKAELILSRLFISLLARSSEQRYIFWTTVDPASAWMGFTSSFISLLIFAFKIIPPGEIHYGNTYQY